MCTHPGNPGQHPRDGTHPSPHTSPGKCHPVSPGLHPAAEDTKQSGHSWCEEWQVCWCICSDNPWCGDRLGHLHHPSPVLGIPFPGHLPGSKQADMEGKGTRVGAHECRSPAGRGVRISGSIFIAVSSSPKQTSKSQRISCLPSQCHKALTRRSKKGKEMQREGLLFQATGISKVAHLNTEKYF